MMNARGIEIMRIGVRFEPDWAPEGLPDFAAWVEKVGYDELWFSEDLPWAGGMVMAAIALTSTERLRVGLGLLPAITRNVATTAMEVAALARIAPCRLTIGLGHGVPGWMEQIGATTPMRLAALEETTFALRRLLNGEKLGYDGKHVHLSDVMLGFPPWDVPPVLVGTTGPAGLRLAGRSSDGVVLPEISSPAAVRWAREQMEVAGSSGSTVVFAMVSVDNDRERALDQTRTRIQRLIDFKIFPRLTEIAGLGADGSGKMTDAILQSLAATGTPNDCAKAVENWEAAGADCLVLVAGADDPRNSYGRFAAEVLPLLSHLHRGGAHSGAPSQMTL
jgi:5,10-methylenetetrahydromethanopterin reductase